MYCGSAKIRDFDYLVYKPIVNEVLLPKYDLLRRASLETLSDNLDLVFELVEQIKVFLRCTITPTDTLLMGTLGCTPAYDTYFRAGVSTVDGSQTGTGSQMVHISQTFGKEGFYTLVKHCEKREKGFQNAQTQFRSYTIMRLVEMYYFDIGKHGL
jgi:hypothetical protein